MPTTTQPSKSRLRNPAFPVISLKEAVGRARKLHAAEPRKQMAPETAASHWGYSVKSSGAQQTLSALKQFGLLIEDKAGKLRKVQLSDLAHRIILDKREDSAERMEAIRKAALTPKVYAELWRKAGDDRVLPSDTELQHYLTLDRSQPFYEDAVNGLIKDFRSTIGFAKLEKSDILRENGGDHKTSIDVGDHVQWTSQGAMRFKEPRRVTGLSDDGEWAFVEGTKAGVPISELSVAASEQAVGEKPNQGMSTPPANPDYAPPIPPGDIALALPVIMDGGGVRNVDIPRMSETAFKFFTDQLETYRSVIVKAEPTKPSSE